MFSLTVKEIRACLIVAPKIDNREWLNGVCVEPTRITSSDGYRVVELSGNFGVGEITTPRQVVHRDVLDKLLKCIGPGKKTRDLVVELTDTTISVPALDISFSVQEYRDWVYPDTSHVWPSEYAGLPSEFNWELVAGCQKAAREWLGLGPIRLKQKWGHNRLELYHESGFRAVIMGYEPKK